MDVITLMFEDGQSHVNSVFCNR